MLNLPRNPISVKIYWRKLPDRVVNYYYDSVKIRYKIDNYFQFKAKIANFLRSEGGNLTQK